MLKFRGKTERRDDESYHSIIRTIIPEFKGEVRISPTASYTINKKIIYLKESSQRDLITIIHEVSHCLVEEIGHGPQFKAKFEELLERARRFGYNVENRCF